MGAGAGYALSRRGKKKESFDEAVVERARELAFMAGYDPDTGEKVASDLDMAALHLLRENGYDV